jgi:hypothetical protein
MGVMPPAWLNQRVLTVLDTPTAVAAASVCSPAAINRQNSLLTVSKILHDLVSLHLTDELGVATIP